MMQRLEDNQTNARNEYEYEHEHEPGNVNVNMIRRMRPVVRTRNPEDLTTAATTNTTTTAAAVSATERIVPLFSRQYPPLRRLHYLPLPLDMYATCIPDTNAVNCSAASCHENNHNSIHPLLSSCSSNTVTNQNNNDTAGSGSHTSDNDNHQNSYINHVISNTNDNMNTENEEDFKCNICLEYLEHPVGCGHCVSRFCRSCLERSNMSRRIPLQLRENVNQSDNQLQNICPACRQEYEFVVPDVDLHTRLFVEKVRCPNRGCGSILSRAFMREHDEKVCHFVMVKCKFSKFGCKWTGFRGDIEVHERYSCTVQNLSHLVDFCRRLDQKYERQFAQIQFLHNQLNQMNQLINLQRKRLKSQQQRLNRSPKNLLKLIVNSVDIGLLTVIESAKNTKASVICQSFTFVGAFTLYIKMLHLQLNAAALAAGLSDPSWTVVIWNILKDENPIFARSEALAGILYGVVLLFYLFGTVVTLFQSD